MSLASDPTGGPMDPNILWTREQHDELQNRIGVVFDAHPELDDQRAQYPWLLGYLGDPSAPVWFVAEKPSLTQIERARGSTANTQWNTSPGDKLFREQLVKYGFKTGPADESGGWRCYITDVVKSAARAKGWNKLRVGERRRVAEMWASVLTWELTWGQPKIVVSVGDDADDLLDHLLQRNLIPAPLRRMKVWHYSYVGMRPHDGQPPGDPETIEEWSTQFAKVVEALKG